MSREREGCSPEKIETGKQDLSEFSPEEQKIQAGRLSEEDAHDEALMVKHKLGLDHKGEMWKRDWSGANLRREKPTAEDIEAAHQAVDEMVMAAQQETSPKRALLRMGKIYNRARREGGVFVAAMFSVFDDIFGAVSGEKGPRASNVLMRNVDHRYHQLESKLQSAQEKLARFQEEARKEAEKAKKLEEYRKSKQK